MFHIPCTSQTRAKHEIPNVSPLWTKAAFAAALTLLGGAQAGMADSAAADIPPPAQIAQARTLCSGIVGVHPGDGRFNGCVASLAASLQSARQEHTIIQARSMCFARGLKPGSSDLALCLLQAAKESPVSAAVGPLDEPTASAKKEDQTAPSYTLTSSLGTVSDKEQQACARTGFDPAFGAFANCIADLQSALQNIDMPTN
jgi:hypothetical protein